jgi:dinuclear metal center YbgI/SA1388 family protein
MESWANPALAEEWDNIGLLIGDANQDVERVLVALDATEAVVTEAVNNKYDFIITHHPLIYNPLKRITVHDPTGNKILRLIRHNIGLYCSHTNLDIATGGVNDILFDALSLQRREPLMESGLGRTGYVTKPMTLEKLTEYVKEKLSLPDARYAGQPSTLIHKVGLCAGDAAGNRYFQTAAEKNCDVYITGDLRYHGIVEALERGLTLIEITHYASEAPIVEAIVSRLVSEASADNVNLLIKPMMDESMKLT